MKTNPDTLLILYEDGNAELATLAKAVEQTVRSSFHAKVRSAGGMVIPDVLGARYYAFLLADGNASCWAELRRVLPGINLAGRDGIVLAPQSTVAAAFSKLFADSELRLRPAADCSSGSVLAWLSSLVS